MTSDVTDRVRAVIAKAQRVPVDSVTVEKTFEELNIDSLDGINIVFALENEFGIDIPDDAAREIRGVRQAIEGVETLLARKPASPARKPASPQRAGSGPQCP